MGADGGVAHEAAVGEADGDGAVVLTGVAEGDGLAGGEPVRDLLGVRRAVGVAVPVQHSPGDGDASDGQAAGDGGDDTEVVAARGEGVGGDAVLERRPGRVVVGAVFGDGGCSVTLIGSRPSR